MPVSLPAFTDGTDRKGQTVRLEMLNREEIQTARRYFLREDCSAKLTHFKMGESQRQSHAEFGSFSAAETVWADVKKKKKQEEG